MARKAVNRRCKGFTISELLIAMLILAQIATFTIPKVLVAQQDVSARAKAKEAAAAVSQAFQVLQANGGVSSSTSPLDLTPYINYVKLDTSSPLDDIQTSSASMNCNGTLRCLRLHNGAFLAYYPYTFAGTASTNALEFMFDPDGTVTSGVPTTNGPGKSVRFFLYYNGRLTSQGNLSTGTTNSNGYVWPACAACEPPWFSWN